MICGYFQAQYGTSVDLFSCLDAPLVEQFDTTDQLDEKLIAAMKELVAQEVGSGAMTAALIKQVLLALLRRSLNSFETWVERFSLFSDAQVSRAFADMVSRPGHPHNVQTLAKTAGLSRSAFVARFAHLFGRPPMMVLRDLRMRRAALLLAAPHASVDRVAFDVGYASRSSFSRVFRTAYGCEPSEFSATKERDKHEGRLQDGI